VDLKSFFITLLHGAIALDFPYLLSFYDFINRLFLLVMCPLVYFMYT
jgi:hypothetical protein